MQNHDGGVSPRVAKSIAALVEVRKKLMYEQLDVYEVRDA